jgi:diacylglycerol kinase family enzyme
VERLFTGNLRTLDLARVTNEYGKSKVFVNNLGIGFDAIVVMRTETITRLQGFLMYFVAVLQTILFYYDTHYLEITFDDEKVNQRTLFLYGGLGPRGGGGFLLTPDARWDDDRIDTCLVDPIGRLRMLTMLSSAMKGTHTTASFVSMRQSHHIEVKSSTPLPIQLDGEMFAYPQDNVRQLTLVSLPAALQVMV